MVLQVALGRNMSEAAVRKVAKGRAWTGHDALRHGLVDALGGLQEALALAKQEAGLPLEVRPYGQGYLLWQCSACLESVPTSPSLGEVLI